MLSSHGIGNHAGVSLLSSISCQCLSFSSVPSVLKHCWKSILDFCPNKQAFGFISYSPYFQGQCIIGRVFSLPGTLIVNTIQGTFTHV